MGTCVGVSAAYQASAQLLCGAGDLVSLEGYPSLADKAQELWRRCDLYNTDVVVGRFDDTLLSVLRSGPFDYAYIDGNHHGVATRRFVHDIARSAAPGALLVLDDIDYSTGMRAAWQDVRHRMYVAASAELGKLGLLVLR